MKYSLIVAVSICAFVIAVTRDELVARIKQLQVDIDDFKDNLLNDTAEFNKGEFWVLEEQETILRDLLPQINLKADNQTAIDEFSKQVDKVEQTIESEVLRIEDILQRGATTGLPIDKDNLLKKAAEYLKTIDDALKVLKVHPLLHVQDLVLLGKQEASLKALISELSTTTDPDVIERNERVLNDLETEIQSEIIRLEQIIREASTVAPK